MRNNGIEKLRNYRAPSEEKTADKFTRIGENHYDYIERRQQVRALELSNQHKDQDQKDRKKYSDIAYLLAINWIVIVMTILGVDGCVQMDDYFEISDSVMITLIGATTASVLGLFAFVMKYLFHRSKD